MNNIGYLGKSEFKTLNNHTLCKNIRNLQEGILSPSNNNKEYSESCPNS